MREQQTGALRRSWRKAAVCIAGGVLLLLVLYIGYQVMQVVSQPNVYQTALLATVEDTISAEGVLLFDETLVPGTGSLGYLAEDGERVSAGAAVAEVYTNEGQASLRSQLQAAQVQIELLAKSQNINSAQYASLLAERSAAIYDLLEKTDHGDYSGARQSEEDFLLAQNKLQITTGEVSDFSAQIAQLQQRQAELQAQLGTPAQIAAPVTGYFIGAENARQLTVAQQDILAMQPAELQAALQQGLDTQLTGCAGKIVAGFSWRYCGVCPYEQGQKLLQSNGAPITAQVGVRFPGRMENALQATVTEVVADKEAGLVRFTLRCDSINGDLLQLGQAQAQIVVGSYTGLRIDQDAVHYVKQADSAAGENYIPGVYVKYGQIARFCRIDPVDGDHPLIQDGNDIIVLPKGSKNSVSEVRLYDEIIVKGKNLFDGKLL